MNSTEAAHAIRTALKSELGLGQKQVSVRKGNGGGSVTVTILVRGVSLESVTAVARRFRSVDTDEATGEILAGGNTFVFTGYASGLFAADVARFLAQIEDLKPGQSVEAAPGLIVARNGVNYFVKDLLGSRLAYDARRAALHVAELLNERVAYANALARQVSEVA